jgi:hypothetical protein
MMILVVTFLTNNGVVCSGLMNSALFLGFQSAALARLDWIRLGKAMQTLRGTDGDPGGNICREGIRPWMKDFKSRTQLRASFPY